MFWYIVLATIPGGAVGFLLDHFVGDALEKPIIIGIALAVMGVILYIVDKNAKANVRLIDCVGFIVPGARGLDENEQPRNS
mgnify:CR=1 FL=1